MKNAQGFTAIEMLLVLALIGIIVAVAFPSIDSFMDKRRVIDAAEVVYTELVYARSEAIARSQNTFVNVFVDPADVNGTTWAIGVSTNNNCNPTLANPDTADACVLSVGGQNVLRRISSEDYPGIVVSHNLNNNQIDFNRLRGTVTPGNAGTLRVRYKDRELQVIVGVIGRVRICMDPNHLPVGGYSSCS